MLGAEDSPGKSSDAFSRGPEDSEGTPTLEDLGVSSIISERGDNEDGEMIDLPFDLFGGNKE